MLQVEWNENLLQLIGEEARRRGQPGIIFWCNSNRWHLYHKRVSYDKVNCQAISENLQRELTTWVDFGKKTLEEIFKEKWDDNQIYSREEGDRFAELVVPTKRLAEEADYRQWILRVLKARELQGPVTLFLMLRLSSIHFNSLN